MRFRRALFWALSPVLLVLLITCGEPVVRDVNRDGVDDGVPSTTVIAPSNPTGTVTGLVLDAATGMPLPEGRSFAVKLIAGTYGSAELGQEQAISDGTGRFRFSDVPASAGITLEVSAEGFATAYAQVALNAAAGNFPTANAHVNVPTFELIELSGQLLAMVLAPDGRAVAGTEVLLDADFAYLLGGGVAGRVHASAVTDDNGLATLSGIPHAALLAHRLGNRKYILTVPPPDIDGDGVPDYTGAMQSVTVTQAALQVAPVTLVVGYPSGDVPLRVVASNIADLVNASASAPSPRPAPSVLPKTGNISIAFNQPVDIDSFLLRMVAEDGGDFFNVSIAADVFSEYGNVAMISLPEALQAGQEYNIYLEARPRQLGNGGAYRGAVAFFVAPSEDVVRVEAIHHEERSGNQMIDAGDYIWFELNIPVGSRRDNGAPAGQFAMLPIRVQVSNIDVQGGGSVGVPDHPMEFGYTGEELAPEAYLIETLPEGGQYVPSGYTTHLRLTLPAGVLLSSGSSVSWVFYFNDALGASAAQIYRVATPAGLLPELPNKSDMLTQDPRSLGDAG